MNLSISYISLNVTAAAAADIIDFLHSKGIIALDSEFLSHFIWNDDWIRVVAMLLVNTIVMLYV